jgi:hypothetical protein
MAFIKRKHVRFDGGDIFLQYIGYYKNHTASTYPRRQHSSRENMLVVTDNVVPCSLILSTLMIEAIFL